MQLSSSYWYTRLFTLAAQVSFALTIVFAPFRWRVGLWARPTMPVYGDYTDFLLFSSDLTIIFTLIFWGSSLLLLPRRISMGSSLVWIPLVGLTLAGGLSIITSEDRLLSEYQSFRLVGLFLFYLYMVNEVKSAVWVILPVTIQILFQSVAAIGQSLLQHSLGWQSLGEVDLNPLAAGVSVVPAEGIRFLRAYGLTDHPNILGGCLAFGLVILLAVVLYGEKNARRFAGIVFPLVILALVMTFSRSAWLGFLVGASVLVGANAVLRRWGTVKRVVWPSVVSVIVLLPFVWQNANLFGVRLNVGGAAENERFEQQSIDERIFLIRAGNLIFVEHSAVGIGLGASPLAMRRYYPEFPTNYQPPHNTLLVAAMETGVIGATFYFILLVAPFLVLIGRWASVHSNPVMIGSFAVLLAVTVVGFFDYYTWLNATGRIWQWLAWGMWSAASAKVT
jgi:O-antigen ligase